MGVTISKIEGLYLSAYFDADCTKCLTIEWTEESAVLKDPGSTRSHNTRLTRETQYLQAGFGKTIFGRVVEMSTSDSNEENSANDDSKSSSNGKGNVTGNINQRILFGGEGSERAFLGQVDDNTPIPSVPGDGTVVSVQKHREEILKEPAEWLSSSMRSKELNFFTEYGEVSRYKVKEIIGEGNSSIVCSAYDTHTGEIVAIKKINNIFENVSVAISVTREIKLLRRLYHPDIVKIKNILLPPSRKEFNDIYVVFERMDCDLHQIIKANDDLTPEHYQVFLYQIFRGLKYIHTANVFHRDLRPKNILATSDCKLKICDFGISRVAFSDQPTGKFWTDYIAARWYRAPELCGSFFSKYTPAIDIWSVGCMFAEILTGKPLFPGKNVVHQLDLMTDLLGTPSPETISTIRNEKARKYLNSMRKKTPFPLVEKFPNTDPLALRLLQRLIAFDPRDRPTAEEALSDPYFKNLADVEREPSAQPITKLEFEFETRENTKEELREVIYREILEYHPVGFHLTIKS
ncbi:unnamed protein product [Lactuca virosa]|uniref:mitogen-activated protein kinase n=1 Tax=Lactuca virosa TaxID=75947 RepID=A0AAU9PGZ2_9ASTR|nr:unnamed protein product [Lactuca virosa]